MKQEDKETAQPDVADRYIGQISLRALLSWSEGSSALSRTEEGKAMGAAGPDMLMIKQMQLALQKELWDRYTKTAAQLDQITLHMNTAKPTLSFKAVDDKFCMAFVGDVLLTKVPGTVYVGSACGIPFFVSGSAYNTLASPLFVLAWFAKEVQEDAATSVAQWEVGQAVLERRETYLREEPHGPEIDHLLHLCHPRLESCAVRGRCRVRHAAADSYLGAPQGAGVERAAV